MNDENNHPTQPSITLKRRVQFAKTMTHVLETGLDYMEIDNPTGKPAVRGYNIINGQLTGASDGGTFRSTNPAHLADCLGEFPLSTRDDVREALHAAHAAFPAWAATPAPTRGQIIGNKGRLMMEHQEALVALETGKSARRSRNQAGKFRKPSTPVCSSNPRGAVSTDRP